MADEPFGASPPPADRTGSVPTQPTHLSQPDPVADEKEGGPGWKAWVAAGAVAALVVGGGVAAFGRSADESTTTDTTTEAAASTGDGATVAEGQQAGGPMNGELPGGRGTSGTITAVDGSTVTVESSDESGTTYTVETSDDTTITEQVEGSLDDLAVGDNVSVMGETADDGSITARSITDGGDEAVAGFGGGPGGGGQMGTPPEGVEGEMPEMPEGTDGEMPEPPEGMDGEGGMPMGGMGGLTLGTVTSVTDDTIVIETDDGEVMVTVTDDTTVTVVQTLTVDDLEAGDTVRVSGETADTTITATRIQVGELTGGFGGGMGGGPGGMGAPGESDGTASSSSGDATTGTA